MKSFFAALLVLFSSQSCVFAIEKSKPSKNCIVGTLEQDASAGCEGFFSTACQESKCKEQGLAATPSYDCEGFCPSNGDEDNDPFEIFNRAIFLLNEGIDSILIEPIALAYVEIFPEFVRTRISYILRNLNEPVVLVNNILQGDLEAVRGTVWRFFLNSTAGVGGTFDVSTDLGLPYKKEDLGLTFASWGLKSGPYLVLPILGPSNVRDGCGRLGDFLFDPINWITLTLHSTTRTATQILDAKADNIEITDDIRKNAIDYYASIRSWYTERRNSLMTAVEDRKALDTPRPDEEEEPDSLRPDEEE